MLFFKKKRGPVVDFSALHADMHSHLLPGIDDGAPDINASSELINGLRDLGFHKLITTPHIMWDMYRNEAKAIRSGMDQLKASLPANDHLPALEAAAEYYLDDHFDSLLEEKQPLLTIKDNLVLVEFSFVNPPFNAKQKLFQLQINGYKPVLAHPERYPYLSGNKKTIDELKYAGCIFQVNLLSLSGYYGRIPFDSAHLLLRSGYVELLGTDLHHARHLHALRNSPQLMPVIESLLDSGRLLNPSL